MSGLHWSRELWFKRLLHFLPNTKKLHVLALMLRNVFICEQWWNLAAFSYSDVVVVAVTARTTQIFTSAAVLQRRRSSISFTSPCLFFPSSGSASVFTPLMSPHLNAGFPNNARIATVMDSYSQEPNPRRGARGERDGCLCLQVQYDEAFNILTRQMSAIKVNNIPPLPSPKAIRGVN